MARKRFQNSSLHVIFLALVALSILLLFALNMAHLQHDGEHDNNNDVPLAEGQRENGLRSPFSALHQSFSQSSTTRQLQSEIDRLQRELQQAQAQLQSLRRTSPATETATFSATNSHLLSSDTSSSSFSSPESICQSWRQNVLGEVSNSTTPFFLMPSALAVWNAHLPRIHDATKHERDRRYVFSDFTSELLQMVSDRLPNSVKTVPRSHAQWRAVGRVLSILHQRYVYLQSSSSSSSSSSSNNPTSPTTSKSSTQQTRIPRKLRIAVMGGSLLVGVNCRRVVSELHLQGVQMPNRLCTWSHRLETFLNRLLWPDNNNNNNKMEDDDDMVEVHKIALGGTNTGMGAVLYKYGLLPTPHPPDIVINAYATNDMHILTMREASHGNQTLRDKVFDMTQQFVRTVLLSRSSSPSSSSNSTASSHCHGGRRSSTPPLLLHMDDYLGNEQRDIWSTTSLAQGVQVLANYYGFASMSYGDVVRDWVYGNTRETWFSPQGWYQDTSTGRKTASMQREIHPGMGMHITSTWVVAYNLLHMGLTYCSMHHVLNTQQEKGMDKILYQEHIGRMPPLQDNPMPEGKPPHPPRGLPPPLTKELNLEDVTELWRASASQLENDGVSLCMENDEDNMPCPFAWVSGLSQQQLNMTWIQELFGEHTAENTGWELVEGDHKKMGWLPTGGLHSKMVLDLQATQPLKVITVFYMKSYGEAWKDSLVAVSTFQRRTGEPDWTTLGQIQLQGVHDKNTSETYTEEIELEEPISVGEDLRISLELVDGTTFKLQGLAICS